MDVVGLASRGWAGVGLKMSLLENPYLNGLVCLLAGAVLGYWLLRWKERNLRAAHTIKEQAILENAQRQADAITREARLQANEAALKLREQTEQSFTKRPNQLRHPEKHPSKP